MVSKYTLSYLPLFYDDLEERVAYLADVLLNPDAATLVPCTFKIVLQKCYGNITWLNIRKIGIIYISKRRFLCV